MLGVAPRERDQMKLAQAVCEREVQRSAVQLLPAAGTGVTASES
jgi:hypothetical protein